MIQQITKCFQLTASLMSQTQYGFVQNTLANLPKHSGVHIIEEICINGNTIFYIGQSDNIWRRVYKNHFLQPAKYSSLYKKLHKNSIFHNEQCFINHLATNCTFRYMLLNNQNDINQLEHFSIAILTPQYND